MKLRHYIKGSRKGKEANSLEREAMTDPFLAEALEGYERMPDAHVERIDVMRKRISSSTRKRHKTIYTWSAVASIIVVFGLGSYFLLHKTEYPIQTQIVHEEQIEQILPAEPENAIALNQREEQSAPPPLAPSVTTEDDAAEVQVLSEEIVTPIAMTADTDVIISEQDIFEEEEEIPVIAQAKVLSRADRASAKERIHLDTVIQDSEEQSLPAGEGSIVPRPVIGDKAYLEYIIKNKIKPTDEECKEVKGRVVVSFLVNDKGRPYDLKIVRSLCPSLDKEAIRLIEKGPDWTIGNQLMHLPVTFE